MSLHANFGYRQESYPKLQEKTREKLNRRYLEIRYKYLFFLDFRLSLVSILVSLVFLVEPAFGAAQSLVRVRSETRIELFVSKRSRSTKIAGTLQDSLGIPLPNQRIEVGVSTSNGRKSHTIVTTGSNGLFAIPDAAKRDNDDVWARFDGNAFYEATDATLSADEIELAARPFAPPKTATTDRQSYLNRRQTENPEPLSVLWLFIPSFLCLAIVVAIKRRLQNPKAKFENENESSLFPGVEISLPVRYARKDQLSISGTIRDLHSSDAIPHVELTLAGEQDTTIALDITIEGFFSSPSLKPGKWRIRALANGYVETTKEFFIPHRGEWTNVRIHMLSMRSLALQPYRKVALALLPAPQLWDIWTARETLHNSRRLLGSMSLFRSLVKRVERSSYGRTPPSNEEVKIIETEASSALNQISRGETDYTVTHRR